MKAVEVDRFGGPEVLRVASTPEPSPISTEVLVAVRAAGINPVDAKTRAGSGVARWVGPPPFVLGWDVAGVVEAVGHGVTRFAPGDRVFGMPRFPRAAAGYAEYVTAPSLQLARIPDGLDDAGAAALPLAALTAWQSLVDAAGVRPGETVLVHGASGGVGHLAIQIAKALGARVVATARPAAHDFVATLAPDELVERPPTGGADVALDLVGGGGTLALLAALNEGGTLVAIADGADASVRDQATVRGVQVVEPLVEPDGRSLDELARLVAAGSLRPAVSERFALDDVRWAHERLERGGIRGKLVLEPL